MSWPSHVERPPHLHAVRGAGRRRRAGEPRAEESLAPAAALGQSASRRRPETPQCRVVEANPSSLRFVNVIAPDQRTVVCRRKS